MFNQPPTRTYALPISSQGKGSAGDRATGATAAPTGSETPPGGALTSRAQQRGRPASPPSGLAALYAATLSSRAPFAGDQAAMAALQVLPSARSSRQFALWANFWPRCSPMAL